MTDLDELDRALAKQETAAATPTGAASRRHRHVWAPSWNHGAQGAYVCSGKGCGKVRDEVAARRGKSSVGRSKREERKLAKDYGGTREGWKGGPIDVATGLLAVQSKAGVGWWSTRYAAELDKLPRTGGRVPALIVSNGQPGSLVRRFVVIDERDFRALYGDRILDGDAP